MRGIFSFTSARLSFVGDAGTASGAMVGRWRVGSHDSGVADCCGKGVGEFADEVRELRERTTRREWAADAPQSENG